MKIIYDIYIEGFGLALSSHYSERIQKSTSHCHAGTTCTTDVGRILRKQCWKHWKAFSPYILHSILIETLQGFLKKVPMIQSGMLIYQKAVQYLGSWISYVVVRLVSNGRTTDINVSNCNRSCYWHIQPFGLSIKEIELDLPRGKPSQYSLGNALSPTKICSLSQGQILTSSEVKIS